MNECHHCLSPKSRKAFVAAAIVINAAPITPHDDNCSPRRAYAKKAPLQQEKI